MDAGTRAAEHAREGSLALKNWTLIGDVGGWETYHVGDEAMLEANLDLFRTLDPTVRLTAVSSDPAFTSQAIGVEVVPRLGFDRCTNDDEREALLTVLSRMPDGAIPAAFERLATPSDGLVISGGGNLTSPWPNFIFERLAFCRRAASVGAKIVFLGQTIGPALEPRHREMVSEMLGLASWVGVREEHSFALALELGVTPANLSYQLDDAATLGLRCRSEVGTLLPFPDEEPWIALTFHPMTNPTVADPLWDQLAEQLRKIAVDTRCRLVFIPHAKAAPSLGAPWSDEDVGKALASRLPEGMLIMLPVMKAREVAALTGRAHMVVSSRYHPIVFGLAAAVPCLAIWTTEYTHVKLQGALSQYGRAGDVCSIEEACDGKLAHAASALWTDAVAIKSGLAEQVQVHVMEEELRKCHLRERIAENAVREIELPRRLTMALAFIHRQADRARKNAEWESAEIARGLEQASASLSDATIYAKSLELGRVEAEKYAQSLENRLNNEERSVAMQKSLTDADLALAERCEELARSVASATTYANSLETQLVARRNDGLELDDMREENRRLQGSVGQLQGELISLSKTHAELVACRSSQRSEGELVQSEVQQMRAQRDALVTQLMQQEAHASNLQQRLRATYASRSWRITHPIRRLKDMLRR